MLPTAVREFACNLAVRGVARRLHVTPLVRRVYCRLLTSGGVLNVSCVGVDAVFKGRNSKQLAFMDWIITTEKYAIEAALRDLKAGDTFLDVGCHYGTYSVLASKLVGRAGRVIAVDPHPESLEILRENLALNRCGNVEVLNFAFSDTTRPIDLVYNEYFAGPQRACDPASAVHTAQGMAGDEVMRGMPIPAVVKIDVEGHEFAVLSGLTQTLSDAACRKLCLEVHPAALPSGVTKDRIMRFIRDRGFNSVTESFRTTEVHVVATR